MSLEKVIEPRRELRSIVETYFRISPAIYWGDLLLSAAIGWALFAAAIAAESLPLRLLLTLAAAFPLYRAMVFTHELVHVPKRELPGFSMAWHLLCGVPLLAPNFLYRQIHVNHHKRGHYATEQDGEYIPFPRSPVMEILLFLGSGLIIPLMAIVRFTLLAPLSLLHPSIRHMVRTKASSMGVRTFFTRELPKTSTERFEWNLYESLCCAYAIGSVCLMLLGLLPVVAVVCWYMLVSVIVTLNAIRAIGCTHYYIHDAMIPISIREQIEDSINVNSNSVVTLLLCPVGTRYHCLHHIFPSMPYHSLRAAHNKLMAELPTDSFYRKLELPSIWTAWHTVWPTKSQGVSLLHRSPSSLE
jgi:fatty acid desaturase